MSGSIHRKLRDILGSPGRLTALTGYFSLATAMVVGIFSVPLALKFMTEEEFGIWNVLGQTLGFLMLIDFGVSSAASRILAEPLQAGHGEEADSWWTVLVSVLFAQGLLMLLIGLVFERAILGTFTIPEHLRGDATLLWRAMVVANALKNPFQAFTGVLFCQNRVYHMHLAAVLSGVANLVIFYVLLAMGWGIKAYIGAVIISVGVMVIHWWIAVRVSGIRLHVRPRLFSTAKLKTLYGYSGSIFLLAVATQIALAAQTMVVASVLGVAAVASFAVSLKSFTVLGQLLSRTIDAKTPRWLMLHVEGKTGDVIGDWRRLMRWFIPIVFFCAAGLLIFNRSFVGIYVSPDMHEGRYFDLILAVTLVAQQLARPLLFVFTMTRRTWGLSFVAVFDALLQLGFSLLFVRWWGPAGIVLGSLLGTMLTSIPFIFLMSPGLLHHRRRDLYRSILPDVCTGIVAVAAVWFLLPHLQAGWGWFPQPKEWCAGIASGLLAAWGVQRFVAAGFLKFRTH